MPVQKKPARKRDPMAPIGVRLGAETVRRIEELAVALAREEALGREQLATVDVIRIAVKRLWEEKIGKKR